MRSIASRVSLRVIKQPLDYRIHMLSSSNFSFHTPFCTISHSYGGMAQEHFLFSKGTGLLYFTILLCAWEGSVTEEWGGSEFGYVMRLSSILRPIFIWSPFIRRLFHCLPSLSELVYCHFSLSYNLNEPDARQGEVTRC